MLDITQVSEKRIIEFQEIRLTQSRTHSRATVNSEVRTLMTILRWAKRKDMLHEVPVIEPIPELPRVVDIPTPEEIGLLISKLRDSAKTVVWFLAETGCRSGEAFNLTWDCVDEVNGWIEIKAKDGWTPKTALSQRQIPIGGALLEKLRSMPKAGKYVFRPRMTLTSHGIMFAKPWMELANEQDWYAMVNHSKLPHIL